MPAAMVCVPHSAPARRHIWRYYKLHPRVLQPLSITFRFAIRVFLLSPKAQIKPASPSRVTFAPNLTIPLNLIYPATLPSPSKKSTPNSKSLLNLTIILSLTPSPPNTTLYQSIPNQTPTQPHPITHSNQTLIRPYPTPFQARL